MSPLTDPTAAPPDVPLPDVPLPEQRIDDLLPLTPAQTGMLFESLGSDDPSMYFEQVRFDLVGPLDLERFRSAWEAMHARHSMLRTVFLWEGLDDPLQAVLAKVELDWNVVDVTGAEVQETEIQETEVQDSSVAMAGDPAPTGERELVSPSDIADGRAVRRRAEGIELGRSPISTFDLVLIDEQRTHVIWSFHHLLLDGWSTARVVGDVLDLYERADGAADHNGSNHSSSNHNGSDHNSSNHSGSGDDEGSDFRPYLEWLADQDSAETTEFWRSLLADVTEPTTLAAHRPRIGDQFERGRIDVALSLDDSARVRAAAASQRVTVNTMVQAAWARALARYAGRPDVVFGVTVSGRPPELDGANDTVGMFLNTLPFPVTVPTEATDAGATDTGATETSAGASSATDTAWLQALQRQQLDVSHHGHASLAEVQRLAPATAGTSRLFDSILIFENYPMRAAGSNASVQVENYGVFEQSHYPLTIMAGDVPDSGTLGFIAVYDESVLAPWFANQLIDDFANELVGLAGPDAEPAGRQSDALAHGDDELSATITASVDHSTVDTAFGHRAIANADDVALRYGRETLTFAKLDARAASVAAELQRLGVGPEVPVGIAIERSINMVVAILGVVRAGGCYLALDPSHPAERTSGILADSRAPIILVDNDDARVAMTAALAAAPGVPASNGSMTPIVLDLRALADPSPTPSQLPAGPTPSATTPTSTLFLTFTSGSTGRPKGVPVHHRGVLRRLAWQYLTYPPAADEVGVAKTTLGFVDHLTELWGPLLAGQTVVLAPDDTVKDVPAFIDLCAREQIRRLVVVPSYLEAMLDAAPDLGSRLPQLDLLTTSGEALPPALARRVATALPGVTVLNIYGMSEATADVSVQPFSTFELARLDEQVPVPAGLPLPGLRVAITAIGGHPLPFGVVGSIDVAGLALSAGYWHRTDLSEERFVERSGPDGAVERWYRTGDLGWMEPSGNLHVVGRSDHQVKVRGMRVELGEIEAAFERHPSVDRCIAVLRDTGDIVAFVHGAALPSTLPPTTELRAHAATLLPSYMAPAAIVALDELPTTPSGKLDRNELARRSSTTTTEGSPSTERDEAGRSDLAAMLGLWRQVLPNADLSADTDFFDAGGHSLLALRLLTRINTAFEAELSLAQVLQAPTPRRLTQLVAGVSQEPDDGEFEYLVPILPSSGSDDDRRTIFCVHGAGGNVLNFRALAKEIEPAFDMVGIQARGVDGVAQPHATMSEVVADYLPAIRSRQPNGPYVLAGYSGGGTIAVELARALESEGETVEATLLLDTFHNDTRPRPFTRDQHLQQLRKRRFGYLVEKINEKRSPSESEDFAPLVSEAQAAGRAIPLEAREWFIKGRMYELIGTHRIEPYDGTVVLLAATETHPGLVYVGHDHGLGDVFSQLEIIDVEGDHHSLVEGHNAPELGRLVLDRLGAADLAAPTETAETVGLDARQHVYRHLPTGLDESPLLARFVRPGSTVLDVGTAATGRSALALEALGAGVVSIEINHVATREFADSDEFRSSAIELATADMVRLPFADASFDTVLVAFHGFDYLVDPSVRARAIGDLARVLRPGGQLIFNSFNTLGILATPAGARSTASWKRRLRFIISGELRRRRLVDNNGLGLHHGRPGQIIAEVEGSTSLRFETMTTLSGNEHHRLLVSAFAPEPNYVFTKR